MYLNKFSYCTTLNMKTTQSNQINKYTFDKIHNKCQINLFLGY